jgi:hypothetical protein
VIPRTQCHRPRRTARSNASFISLLLATLTLIVSEAHADEPLTLSCVGKYNNFEFGGGEVEATQLLQLYSSTGTLSLGLYGDMRITNFNEAFFGSAVPWMENGVEVGTTNVYLNRYTGELSASHLFARQQAYHDIFNARCQVVRRQF